MFLKDNRRIASLVFVVYLALLIYCLLEREARRALADPNKARWTPPAPERFRRRTYAIHDPTESGKVRWAVGMPAERPTGSNILRKFEGLTLATVTVAGQQKVLPPQLNESLVKLHDLLGIPAPFFL